MRSQKIMIDIRRFKRENAEEVSYLIRKALTEVNSKDYSQELIQFLCKNYSPERIVEESSNLLMCIAIENERILGTISLKNNVILGLFVNPKFHDKGFGTKLMDFVEAIVRKRNYKSVIVPSSTTA